MHVILPCAGKGSRLGLEYPKELYQVFEGIRLIDFSLSHIQSALDIVQSVSIVIIPGKESVWEYVSQKLNPLPVHKVYFNHEYHEWAGSVLSAQENFLNKNLALLPDSVIQLSNESGPIIERVSKVLDNHSTVFPFCSSSNHEKLQQLGAMKVDRNGTILQFEDKPQFEPNRFNSFWACYGFDQQSSISLYKFLAASIRKEKPIYTNLETYPFHGIPVKNYWDLGTWNSIHAFKESHSPNSFNISS